MQVIELSAKEWKSTIDVYDAIGRAQYEHDGRTTSNVRNINALLELLVWDVWRHENAPYTIRVSGVSGLPAEIREEITLIKTLLAEARAESVSRRSVDVKVLLEILD